MNGTKGKFWDIRTQEEKGPDWDYVVGSTMNITTHLDKNKSITLEEQDIGIQM